MRSPNLNLEAALAVAKAHADSSREAELRTLLANGVKTWMDTMYDGIVTSSSNTERLNKAKELMQTDVDNQGTEETIKVTAGLAAAMSEVENGMEEYWSQAGKIMDAEASANKSVKLNAATRTLLQVVAESATSPQPKAEPLNISELLTNLITTGECDVEELGTVEQIRAGEIATKPLHAVLQALDQTAADVKLTPAMLQKVLLKRKGDGPDMLMTTVVGKPGTNTKIYVFARRWTNAEARVTSVKTTSDTSTQALSRNDLDLCGGQSIADHFTLNGSEIEYDLQILEMKGDTLQLRQWTEKEDAATLGGSWKKAVKRMNRQHNRLLVSSASTAIKTMAAVMPKGKLSDTLMLWRNREEAQRWLQNDKEVKLTDRANTIRTSSTKWVELAIPEGSPGPESKKRPASAQDETAGGGLAKKLDMALSPAKEMSVKEAVAQEADDNADDEAMSDGDEIEDKPKVATMSDESDCDESDEDTDSDEEMDEVADADNKKATKSRGKRKVKIAGVSEFLKPVKKGADPKSKKKK